MEGLVPPNVIPDVTCFVINEDLLAKEKDGVEVTVCVSSGKVIEFLNKSAVDSCYIPCAKPSSITVFYAYKPYVKYYVIQQQSDIVVVEKNEKLIEFKLLSNVSRFEIDDFLECGHSQVKLWFEDEMEPLLTDFSNCWPLTDEIEHRPRYQSKLFLTLNGKLQAMKLRLDDATKLNNEKRKCRTRALFEFESNINKCPPLKDCEDESFLNAAPVPQSKSLRLETPWQRIMGNWWIVCVPVFNSSDQEVKELKLHLHGDEDELKYKSHIFMVINTSHNSCIPLLKVTSVPPNSNAFIVGVIEVPGFALEGSCKVSGILSYNLLDDSSNGCRQIHFSPFVLNTTDLLSGHLVPFSSDSISVQDIVAVMSVNEEVMLEVKTNNSLCNLSTLIQEKLEFTAFSFLETSSCYVFRSNNSKALSGFLLFTKQNSDMSWSLICYISNEKQLMVFVHSLLNILPHCSSVTRKPEADPSLSSAVRALSIELKFLADGLTTGFVQPIGQLPDEAEIKFTGDVWKELRRTHSLLELNTDLAFQGLQ